VRRIFIVASMTVQVAAVVAFAPSVIVTHMSKRAAVEAQERIEEQERLDAIACERDDLCHARRWGATLERVGIDDPDHVWSACWNEVDSRAAIDACTDAWRRVSELADEATWQRFLWDRRRISTGTGLLITDDPSCPASETCTVVFQAGEYPSWDAPEPSFAGPPAAPDRLTYLACSQRVPSENLALRNEIVRRQCSYLKNRFP
jgi:hypothetical protein